MAKRYDITPLGESLLSDQDRRRKENDNDDDIWKSLALTMGIGIGNRILDKRANQFAQDERILSAKVKNETDYQNKLYVKDTRAAIEASRKGAETFFADNNFERLFARRLEDVDETTLSPEGKDMLAAAVRIQAGKLGKEQAQLFYQAESAAQRVISPEDFEARAQLANSRPRNVGGWFADKMVDLFGGRSQSEIDNDAIEALREQGERPGEALDLFKTAYDKGLGWSAAAELTEIAYPTKPIEAKYTTQVQQMQDGSLRAITVKQSLNPDGTHKGAPEVSEEKLGDYGDANTGMISIINDINKHSRFAERARTALNPEKFAELSRDLIEKEGINIRYFESIEQLQIAAKRLTEFESVPENLKDDFQNEMYIEFLKTGLDKITKIDFAKIMGETDPEKQRQMLNDLFIKVTNSSSEIRSGMYKAPRDYSDYTD